MKPEKKNGKDKCLLEMIIFRAGKQVPVFHTKAGWETILEIPTCATKIYSEPKHIQVFLLSRHLKKKGMEKVVGLSTMEYMSNLGRRMYIDV